MFTRNRPRAVVLIGIALLSLLSAVPSGFPEKSAIKPKGTNTVLTKEEASFLRTVIYKEGISITVRVDLPLPQRQVVLRSDVIALHKKKRIPTIKLLLEIVRGARPMDARAAGVIALALEEDPADAVLWAYGDLESFDTPRADDLATDRERLVEEVEKALRP